MLRVPFPSAFSAPRPQTLLDVGLLVLLGLALGCGGTTVKRTAVEEEIDLSGLWNDVDSQQVSEEMIND